MKMELRIDGKVIVIEAEGAVSVQIIEEKEVVRVPAVAPVVVPEVVSEIVQENAPENGAGSEDLFAKLADLRRELSAAQNVPPYVIFKDKTLLEMVEKRPSDLAEFANIGGVGKAKLEKYGAAFLAVIEGAAA